MNEYIYIGCYLFAVCCLVKTLAEYESFLDIWVSDRLRVALFIFSFQRPKISAFCIISQVFFYFMIALFVVSRFFSIDFLRYLSDNPNALYQNLLKMHLMVFFPIAFLEEGVCYWIKRGT